jgi:hypothetical protein
MTAPLTTIDGYNVIALGEPPEFYVETTIDGWRYIASLASLNTTCELVCASSGLDPDRIHQVPLSAIEHIDAWVNENGEDPDDDDDACDNQFGLFCPQCGASDQLDITATVKVRLTADGTDEDQAHNGGTGHEWHDESPCTCLACDYDGTVAEFEPAYQAEKKAIQDRLLHPANLAKLPPQAFVENTGLCTGPHGIPPVISVTRGETGYNPIYTNMTAAALNEASGVTPAQARAMFNGSLFGWGTPGADPDNPINQKD